MRTAIVDGVPTLVETRRERVEWYIREHPGVSAARIDMDLGDGASSIAMSLFTDGILRSWRDVVGTYKGKPWHGYRYAHTLTPRDSPMDSEVIDFDRLYAERDRTEAVA